MLPFLGDDIGQQFTLYLSDRIFEGKLSFLQSLQLQLIEGSGLGQLLDELV